jgi:predicted 2-oxoglutarate/Fe(II)-dependent dioxygenase YbiX
MSLEVKIEELTAAIKENTAALKAAGSAAPASGKAETNTKADKANKTEKTTKSGPTREEVNAALVKVKDAHGADAAKKLIADVAGVAKMADIKEAKFEAVLAACEKALSGEGDEDDNL